jgi:hypothetical protein
VSGRRFVRACCEGRHPRIRYAGLPSRSGLGGDRNHGGCRHGAGYASPLLQDAVVARGRRHQLNRRYWTFRCRTFRRTVDLRVPTDQRPKAFAHRPTRSRQPRRSAQVGISSGSSDRADRQRCSLNLPLDQHGEHFAGAAQIEGIIPTAGLDRTNTCTPHVAGGLRMGRRRGSSRLCHRRDCGSHVGSPRMSRARYSWNRRRCRQALTVWSERTALTS